MASIPLPFAFRLLPSFREYRGYHRHIRQVRAACVRIIEDYNIAGSELQCLECSADRHRHRAEMYRHMITLSNKDAVLVEDGAGIVSTLFYVRGESGATKAHAHFFRN